MTAADAGRDREAQDAAGAGVLLRYREVGFLQSPHDVARTLMQYAAISWVLVALIAVTAARVERRHGPVEI